jgi:hypothetical protein
MEDKEEDVSSYWMILEKTKGYWKLKEKAVDRLCGKRGLEEPMDLS